MGANRGRKRRGLKDRYRASKDARASAYKESQALPSPPRWFVAMYDSTAEGTAMTVISRFPGKDPVPNGFATRQEAESMAEHCNDYRSSIFNTHQRYFELEKDLRHDRLIRLAKEEALKKLQAEIAKLQAEIEQLNEEVALASSEQAQLEPPPKGFNSLLDRSFASYGPFTKNVSGQQSWEHNPYYW